MKHLRWCAIAFGALLFACAKTTTQSDNKSEWPTLTGTAPIIIAHRGASGYRPEHTLEAYALAIEQGADFIEPDLVMTKDGVLVARHDRYLSTTTNIAAHPEFAARKRANKDPQSAPREDWWVEDFTLAELKTLRARQPMATRSSTHDDRYEIPTFDEVLALVEKATEETGRPIGVYPETKYPGYFAAIGLDFKAPLLAALAPFKGPLFIQSFEPQILIELNAISDAPLVQLVYEDAPGDGVNIPLSDIASYADGVGPQKTLLVTAENCATRFVADAHALGLLVHPWTFRDDKVRNADANAVCASSAIASIDDELDAMLALGVDGLFSDFPDTAIAARHRYHSEK